MPDKPNTDLNQIAAPPPEKVSLVPNAEYQLEHAIAQKDRFEIENQDLRQNIAERKRYAERSFWLLVVWLAFIGVIVFFQGFRFFGFELANSVIITLIGSTTASVVGIFLIVSRYLFAHRLNLK
jgi:hypothetical protein